MDEKKPTPPGNGTHTGDHVNISLEAAHLETTAVTLPEAIRDDFIWFGGFIRDRCNRNLEVLTHKTRKLGFKTDKTTFSKLLRGRYQTDAEGNRTANPIISPLNFAQIVDALRSETQLVWLSGKTPFIDTGTWTEIEEYITYKRLPETICKFGLILGPTGSQKTTCLRRYVLLNNSGKCVHLEAPEKPTMGRFVRELATTYGIPERIAGEKLRIRITSNVTERKTIIVDNIQRLYKPAHGWNQEIFNYLQKLQDDTNCTIILCAVPGFENTIRHEGEKGYFEQFVGRVGGWNDVLRLDEWTPRADIEAIAEAFKLQHVETHLPYLEKLSRQPGRIRILFNCLQKAKRLADAAGQRLTIKHLKTAQGEEE